MIKLYTTESCPAGQKIQDMLTLGGLQYTTSYLDGPQGAKEALEVGSHSLPLLHVTNRCGSDLKIAGRVSLKDVQEFLQ